jgi:hypothetical protein
MTEVEIQSLRRVLDGLTFPAQRWEIITKAGWYGADAVTTARLQQLPARPYRDLRDVLLRLDEIPT